MGHHYRDIHSANIGAGPNEAQHFSYPRHLDSTGQHLETGFKRHFSRQKGKTGYLLNPKSRPQDNLNLFSNHIPGHRGTYLFAREGVFNFQKYTEPFT